MNKTFTLKLVTQNNNTKNKQENFYHGKDQFWRR